MTRDAGCVLTLDVAVRGDWDEVERVRTSVWHCVTAAVGPFDVRDAFAMVVAELLENAVKHGAYDDGAPAHVSLLVDPPRGRVTVRNTVGSARAAERVLRSLEWLRSFSCPAEAYRARLLALAERPDENGSGLGLARIAYEGGCTLSADYDGGMGVLSVTAELALERAPDPRLARSRAPA